MRLYVCMYVWECDDIRAADIMCAKEYIKKLLDKFKLFELGFVPYATLLEYYYYRPQTLCIFKVIHTCSYFKAQHPGVSAL